MFEKALTISIERDGGGDDEDVATALKDLGKALESQVKKKGGGMHDDDSPECSTKRSEFLGFLWAWWGGGMRG